MGSDMDLSARGRGEAGEAKVCDCEMACVAVPGFVWGHAACKPPRVVVKRRLQLVRAFYSTY